MRATLTAIIFISLFFFSSVQAQDRSGGWEWAISAVYQDSKDLGSAGGSTLNIDEGIGIGFNLSYPSSRDESSVFSSLMQKIR